MLAHRPRWTKSGVTGRLLGGRGCLCQVQGGVFRRRAAIPFRSSTQRWAGTRPWPLPSPPGRHALAQRPGVRNGRRRQSARRGWWRLHGGGIDAADVVLAATVPVGEPVGLSGTAAAGGTGVGRSGRDPGVPSDARWRFLLVGLRTNTKSAAGTPRSSGGGPLRAATRRWLRAGRRLSGRAR